MGSVYYWNACVNTFEKNFKLNVIKPKFQKAVQSKLANVDKFNFYSLQEFIYIQFSNSINNTFYGAKMSKTSQCHWKSMIVVKRLMKM